MFIEIFKRTCCWQVKSEPGGMSVQMQGLGGGSSWTGEAGTPGQRPHVVWQKPPAGVCGPNMKLALHFPN